MPQKLEGRGANEEQSDDADGGGNTARWFELARHAIKYVARIGYVYFTYLSIDAIAGKHTFFQLILNGFGNAQNVLAVIIFILVGAWACLENWLRRSKTKYFQNRITELEKLHDPQRSTSGLLTNGQTNPRDKP